jgi:hypothetical protein
MRFGSLTNSIDEAAVIGQPEPEIGMGATILSWSDRAPGTIIRVERDRGSVVVTVREDAWKRLDKNGMSECQNYEYLSNPEGVRSWFRRLESGRWVEVTWNYNTKRYNMIKGGGHGLRIGERERYHDYSF